MSVEIDRDAAHDAAQRELSKPIYPRGSLTDRLSDWLDELLYKLVVEGASVPGGWFTLTVLMLLVAVAVVVAVRIAMRTMRTNRGRDSALFGANELTSAEHRATAEQLGGARQLVRGDPAPPPCRRPPPRGDAVYSTPCRGAPPPSSRATRARSFPV